MALKVLSSFGSRVLRYTKTSISYYWQLCFCMLLASKLLLLLAAAAAKLWFFSSLPVRVIPLSLFTDTVKEVKQTLFCNVHPNHWPFPSTTFFFAGHGLRHPVYTALPISAIIKDLLLYVQSWLRESTSTTREILSNFVSKSFERETSLNFFSALLLQDFCDNKSLVLEL